MRATLALFFSAAALALPLSIGTYADARHGLTLEYPTTWSLTKPLPFYLLDPILSDKQPAVAALSLTAGYKGTDFAGAELIYAVRPHLLPAACAALVTNLDPQAHPVTVNGVPFLRGHAGDAAMMKQRADTLYSTTRNGDCYLFDLALLTAGYGAVEGLRQMTRAQRAAVEADLQQIFSSVQFHSLAPRPR